MLMMMGLGGGGGGGTVVAVVVTFVQVLIVRHLAADDGGVGSTVCRRNLGTSLAAPGIVIWRPRRTRPPETRPRPVRRGWRAIGDPPLDHSDGLFLIAGSESERENGDIFSPHSFICQSVMCAIVPPLPKGGYH